MAWMKAPKKLKRAERIAERDRKGREAANAIRDRLKSGGHMLTDVKDIHGKPTEASTAPTMPKPHTGPVPMYTTYAGNCRKKGGSCGLTAQFDSSVAASKRDLDRSDRREQDQPSDKGHPSRERRRRRYIADNKRRVNL